MVFFVCSVCGQSLKKNQVEKHYMSQCRNCEMLTCMDCNKEFWGDDFKAHTSCISEDQKYGGKDFKPKPSQNKGLVKQESWIESVRTAATFAQVSSEMKSLVEKMTEFSNIPRKKSKFENFARNSLKMRNQNKIEEIWLIFSQSNVNGHANNDISNEDEAKKRKSEDQPDCDIDNNKKVKLEEPVDENRDVKKAKFKCTKVLKTFLREREGSMPLKELREKMLKEYKSFVKDSLDFDEKEFLNSLQERITSCKKFEIVEYVKLVER